MPAPLEGVEILDRSAGVAGRYCGGLFAALGARVVRSQASDDRFLGYGGASGAAFGAWLDRDKESAASAGLAAADLIIADDVGEGSAAAGAQTLRLDISWFGADGAYRSWSGNDAIMPALIGAAYSFGPAPGPPVLAQGHAPQIVAGVTAFIAALSALIGRRRGIKIGRASASVFEAAMCFSETQAVSYDHFNDKARRVGVNRFVPTYPCANYRAADGWIGVTCLTPAQWEALCAMLERPDCAADPRFATSVDRLRHADKVDAILAPALAGCSVMDTVREGQARRIPIAPVPDMADLLRTEHWARRVAFAPLKGIDAAAPTLPFRIEWQGGAKPLPPLKAGSGPLAGIRIVDFSMGWAGPLATRHLGDLGADVVKIEAQTHPDWWRGWERSVPGASPTIELQPVFNATNRSKRGATIDLRSDEGLAAAKSLIRGADIVVENLGPGVLAKLGLGAEALHAINPELISISMGAFGASGPWAGFRAYGSTVEQASGLPTVNGREGWPPALQHIAYGDPVAGLYAAAAALAGLAGRERLGGCKIDLAQVECLFQLGADAILARQVMDAPLPRTGSRRMTMAPCCCVAAAGDDRWLAVACSKDAEWRELAKLLDRDDLAALSLPDRNARAAEIEDLISEWAASRQAGAAANELQRVGVAAAPVRPYQELVRDPHLVETGFWKTLERPFVGEHLVAAPPYRFDGKRPLIKRPAPTLGEHNEELIGGRSSAQASEGGGETER